MTTLLLSHPASLEHLTPPGHPERPDRIRAVNQVLAEARFDQLARDRKTKPEATGTSAGTAIEFLENLVLFARRETGAVIGDRKNKHGIVARHARFDRLITYSMGRRV